jgi:multicomponent Na+:H+ antiporter subunit E
VGNSVRLVSLALVLFVFWLLLSGHYTGLLIALGIISSVGTAALAMRMAIADREGHPIELLPRAVLFYWPWLAKEIAVAVWQVSRIIVDPKLPISPTLLKVTGSQKSDLGIATYGNSITLTPGTVTVGVRGSDLVVHALTRDGADSLAEGTMDRRVSRFEGAR